MKICLHKGGGGGKGESNLGPSWGKRTGEGLLLFTYMGVGQHVLFPPSCVRRGKKESRGSALKINFFSCRRKGEILLPLLITTSNLNTVSKRRGGGKRKKERGRGACVPPQKKGGQGLL